MGRLIVGYMVVLVLLVAVRDVYAGYREVIPKYAKQKVVLYVEGKRLTYFGFDAEDPLRIRLKGPVELKILSRLDFTPGMGRSERYVLRLVEKGKVVKVFRKRTKPSSVASYPGIKGIVPGQKRVSRFRVPPGMHEYELYLSGTGAPSAKARLFVKTPRKRIRRIPIMPKEYVSSLRLFVRERGYDYYLLTRDRPIRIEVPGPARLKVFSRLNYDYKMRGRQVYTIQVLSEGREIKRVRFRTTKSQKAHYEGNSPFVPSVADKFFINIPEGRHLLEFRLIGGESAALKFLIPENALLRQRR